jgi:hypothetical protein
MSFRVFLSYRLIYCWCLWSKLIHQCYSLLLRLLLLLLARSILFCLLCGSLLFTSLFLLILLFSFFGFSTRFGSLRTLICWFLFTFALVDFLLSFIHCLLSSFLQNGRKWIKWCLSTIYILFWINLLCFCLQVLKHFN